ncbi:hypothetical protein MATL_G00235640 [Megalops atlanticus]|uniref:Uncharacterized protein n=1 Tax=Megalops atlanticus TaxID=7932 RepID=A0A9D3T2F5_MEGAT|nr:hypothetical protein MATL_G00235640 [Megalops atlanticus]
MGIFDQAREAVFRNVLYWFLKIIARFLMRRHQCMEAEKVSEGVLCPFCFQWRQADNHRVRLKPKGKVSPRERKALRREAARKVLSPDQLKALKRYRSSSSTLMATCHTCNKTSKNRGASRDFLAAISKGQGTPGNGGKQKGASRTPHSGNGGTLPKSAEKTPYGTPRSASSQPSGSTSKSAEGKKSAFARLRKLLVLEDTPASKKGGLKAFLSSL